MTPARHKELADLGAKALRRLDNAVRDFPPTDPVRLEVDALNAIVLHFASERTRPHD